MKKILIISLISLFSVSFLSAQVYKFDKPVKDIKVTSVKNQASTGTCWCFATISFLEAELIRQGKGEYDLSEMYVVRYNYMNRINDNFLRRGKGNLGQGSIAHMATKVIAEHGIVPEDVYTGINYNSPTHRHGDLNGYINAIAAESVKQKARTPEYYKLLNSMFDIWLGEVPEKFNYKGKEYTPKSFANSLGMTNMEEYIEITSFSHHPFYTQFPVEIPDNWDNEKQYNVPLDEMMEIMDYALTNGYTIAWDGDVSERGFAFGKGVAINAETDLSKYDAEDRARFGKLNTQDLAKEIAKLEKMYPEVKVDQKVRQDGFESFVTTDDHLMHITGLVKDQNGTKYYVTKNSWGTGRNGTGYLNMSESYVRAKTISFMIHKDALPKAIKTKLGIK